MSQIELEESNFHSLKYIEPGYDRIKFSNSQGIEIDLTALIDHLCTVEGTDQIERLVINHSSKLKDLDVIRAFPNLRHINVYGNQITSLDGLEWFQQGEFIEIYTESNRRRKIGKIATAPIKRMILQCARSEDLETIADCLTLNSLDLFRSEEIEFSKWSHLPLESLNLKQCKFRELGNTADITSLDELRILGCRNLERFIGDNSRITYMIIEGSKKLDLRSLQTFQNIKSLIVNGNPNEFALSKIGQLRKLESLWLTNCNVQVDISNLKQQFPSLDELLISNMKKEQVAELSQVNPGISIRARG